MTLDERCVKEVPTAGIGIHYHRCLRRGVIQEEGEIWCKQHAPSAVAAKEAQRDKKWTREWRIRDAKAAVWQAERMILDAVRQGTVLPGSREVLLDADRQLRELRSDPER